MSIKSFYMEECSSPVFLSSSATTPCDYQHLSQLLPSSPSYLINNDIYLSAISTDNEQQLLQLKNCQTTQLSQSSFDSFAIISPVNSIPTIPTNRSLIDSPNKTNTNDNNKIKSFFKLLKPSIYKKRSKKIHLKPSVSFNSTNTNSLNESDEIGSNSVSHRIDDEKNNRIKMSSKRPTAVTRSATTKKRMSGVLIANPLVNTHCLDVNASNMILYRNRMSLNRRKPNQASLKLHKSTYSNSQANNKLKATKATSRAKRAFSMITPIRSYQLANVSNQVVANNHNNKQLTKLKNYAIHTNSLSKELTWYKLEELDHYYKILGNNKNNNNNNN